MGASAESEGQDRRNEARHPKWKALMNTNSLIDILCLQRNYLSTLLEQLIDELMRIGCSRATDSPPSVTAAAHMMMLGAYSYQIVGEIKRLQVYVVALELTNEDAQAASSGS